MARLESQAVGGYYPFPPQHIPAVAALIDPRAMLAGRHACAVLDPCAGDGAAVLDLIRALVPADVLARRDHNKSRVDLYACELEASRAKALGKAATELLGWQTGDRCLHGDAMRVVAERHETYQQRAGGSLLFLNPPYDQDRELRRLEERFLRRATEWLGVGGVLVLVVPNHALAASAETLARHYERLACFRLPEPDFAIYQQVVLYATRRAPLAGDLAGHPVVGQVLAWAADATCIPVLPRAGEHPPVATLPVMDAGFSRWLLAPVDMGGLLAGVRPWVQGAAPRESAVRGVGVDLALADLIGRQHPVAQPLRAGHIAQALAAGMLNGKRITPDDPARPPLLIKGVFVKEFQTVETRKNKKGEATSQIQVQQPRLRLSVLDLHRYTYHDLRPGVEPTGASSLDEMSIADVLQAYSASIRQLLLDQCPPLHQPGDGRQLALPLVARRPFQAQADAIQTLVKLLGRGDNPFLLGEVGTGKTLMSQAVAWACAPAHRATVRAQLRQHGYADRLPLVRTVLVLCPPHLVKTWPDEMRSTLPGARVVVLERPSQVAALAGTVAPESALPGSGMTFLILSREAAKLGHALAPGVRAEHPICPACGRGIGGDLADLVANRLICGHTPLLAQDTPARLAVDLATLLAPVAAESWEVSRLAPRALLRLLHRRAKAAQAAQDGPGAAPAGAWYQRVALPALRRLAGDLATHLAGLAGDIHTMHAAQELLPALTLLLLALPERDDLILDAAEAIYRASVRGDAGRYGTASDVRAALRTLLLLAERPDAPAYQERVAALRALSAEPGYGGATWGEFDQRLLRLARERAGTDSAQAGYDTRAVAWIAGSLTYRVDYQTRVEAGDMQGALRALALLAERGTFDRGVPCRERLYQATPSPRRYPLATFIARRAPDLFDLLLLDEGQEYNSDGAAQELAAHRLAALGKPTLVLSGSIMNGYVSSLFSNMWAISPAFRAAFGRDDRATFVTRYGYRKRLIDLSEDRPRGPARFGSVTDRRDDEDLALTRSLGEAPGVLPLFLLDWMLPRAALIHKADLEVELPPMVEIPVPVALDSDVGRWLGNRGRLLQRSILDRITRDRFEPGKAGKLFGALGQAVSYYDRATGDTGNVVDGGVRLWESRYPESVGSELVARADLFEPDLLLPKEAWLIATLRGELAQGRNAVVFVTNSGGQSGLMQRLSRLLGQELNVVVSVLDVGKVAAKVRQTWIDGEKARGCRVLIVNPTAIKTGLNNLVPHFSVAIWFQNPNADAITYRQANGRLHRIGQVEEVRVYVPFYAQTSQELAQGLLARKVAASLAIDGLDVTDALDAAGAGDGADGISMLEMGRALYALLIQPDVGRRAA